MFTSPSPLAPFYAYTPSGLIWKLIPMLLAFDGTLQGDYSDESSRAVYNQNACNMHAVLATKVKP